MRHRRLQTGIGVLAVVVVFGAIASVVVMTTHSLWRGSSRTLFSVQEHRQLINLARSALAEAHYMVQKSLDECSSLADTESRYPDRKTHTFDWCTSRGDVGKMAVGPEHTMREALYVNPGSLFNPDALSYTVSEVGLSRVRALDPDDGSAMGILDMTVIVRVNRTAPAHHAELTMTQRHEFRLADDLGPFASAGRHIEVSPTPAGTVIVE
jgi:hypothetical protein